MKPSTTVARLAGYLSWIIALILILLPFHAFLTVWASSAFGHYTPLRLWKEGLITIVFVGAIYILAVSAAVRKQLFSSWLVRLIAIYAVLVLICGAVAFSRHGVNLKAFAYGTLLDLRFLVFFLLVWVVAACSPILRLKWRRLLLVPAALVVVFGIIQYLFLPYDFLKHFGYGTSTISPYETINHDIHYIRIESMLRGANPLGAYLVLIISALTALLVTGKNRLWQKSLFGIAVLAALVFSYSRSAWIGAALSVIIVLWLSLKTPRAKKLALVSTGVIIVIGGVAALALRHSTTLQDAFLHTNNQSQAPESSNQGHAAAFRAGLHDIARQPLGGGTGTAGPASIYNNHPSRIAENYFLQIGQEAGILGLVLFVAINVEVARKLWLKRADPLALALLGSLVGLSFVNMLSHAWTDDTLAYIWWGLAGIALAPAILKANKHKQSEKIQQEST
jgi:hypothetical protein